jgi:hypothetical protein
VCVDVVLQTLYVSCMWCVCESCCVLSDVRVRVTRVTCMHVCCVLFTWMFFIFLHVVSVFFFYMRRKELLKIKNFVSGFDILSVF